MGGQADAVSASEIEKANVLRKLSRRQRNEDSG